MKRGRVESFKVLEEDEKLCRELIYEFLNIGYVMEIGEGERLTEEDVGSISHVYAIEVLKRIYFSISRVMVVESRYLH